MNASQFKAKIREITNTTTSDYSDASLIRDLNSELSMIQIDILRDRGVLEFDDSNFLDLPIAVFPIVSGRKSYKITADEDGNAVLAIHKVAIDRGDGYFDIPRLQVGEGNQDGLVDESEAEIPNGYYEVGSSIVFSQTPQSGTVKVWFDRDISFLTVDDTVKIPGIPTAYHNLACYRTALNYAVDKGAPNEDNILRRVTREEERLEQYEENRRGDESTILQVATLDDGI
jgi:hypothetical protein